MGVYQYTLRKGTKDVDGLTIGRYAFAYKLSNRLHETGPYKRMAAIKEAAAERAADAQPDLMFAIVGDWPTKDDARTVFRIDRAYASFADYHAPGDVVGHLMKVGRGYKFVGNGT